MISTHKQTIVDRMEGTNNGAEWYALRILHNKRTAVCAIADKGEVEHYTPTRLTERVVAGRTIRTERPLLGSLLFVRCTTDYIDHLRRLSNDNICPYCEPGSSKPKAIPEEQMEAFRFVVRTACREIELLPTDIALGERVRITDGPFRGVEGHIHRIHGTKRLVVAIDNVAVVATTYIPRQYIEKITPARES